MARPLSNDTKRANNVFLGRCSYAEEHGSTGNKFYVFILFESVNYFNYFFLLALLVLVQGNDGGRIRNER